MLRERASRKLWLCQDLYIKKIALTYALLAGQKAPATPLPTGELVKYKGTATLASVNLY